MNSMAASMTSSINWLKHPMYAIASANEEQHTLGLVVQPVTLEALHGIEGTAQCEPTQEQGAGKVGWRAVQMPKSAWWSVLLTWRNVLIPVVVCLAVASVNNLAPVASRVICWASTWKRPVLSAVVIVCLM